MQLFIWLLRKKNFIAILDNNHHHSLKYSADKLDLRFYFSLQLTLSLSRDSEIEPLFKVQEAT